MIKKIVMLIIMILLINLIINKNDNIKQLETVFKETYIEDNNYQTYILDLSDLNITTNNLSKILTNISIKNINIYPKINELYKDKLDKITYYKFNYSDLSLNITKFKETYIEILKNNGFFNDIDNIRINGIPIEKIEVYLSNDQLNNIIKQYPNIKYQ